METKPSSNQQTKQVNKRTNPPVDRINLFFNCQSCQQYVLTSNIQCPNGHQVCHSCSENLSDCPTCHQRVAPSTRAPYLLMSGVKPILDVSESFDLLLPTLLRLAPALHPCDADEMIFTGDGAKDASDLLQKNDSSMQRNNTLANQLLIADTSCEVEETLSRLMLFASMSSRPSNSPLVSTTVTTSTPEESWISPDNPRNEL